MPNGLALALLAVHFAQERQSRSCASNCLQAVSFKQWIEKSRLIERDGFKFSMMAIRTMMWWRPVAMAHPRDKTFMVMLNSMMGSAVVPPLLSLRVVLDLHQDAIVQYHGRG